MAELGALLGGRYRLDQVLGQGGMATIFRATDSKLGRQVAVKVLRPAFESDAQFVERFEHEAQAAASLNHPNIVAVYDFGNDPAGPYIVMEQVAGGDLSIVLGERGALPPTAVARTGQQVADALAAAHARGLVHRDIKPSNILLSPDGRVQVADFGIAQAAAGSPVTATGITLGSVLYFSPEQARGDVATAASDIYSLGLVMYEMLTGRRAFSGDSPAAVAVARLTGGVPSPMAVRPEVPPALDAIVRWCLSVDPAARPSASQLSSALARFITDPAGAATYATAAGVVPAGMGAGGGVTAAWAGMASVPPPPAQSVASPAGRATSSEPERSGTGPWAWTAAGLGLVVIVASGILLFLLFSTIGEAAPTPSPTPSPTVQTVVTPDFVGRRERNAIRVAERAGLILETEYVESEQREAGRVIDQLPQAGVEIPHGTSVHVTIATRTETIVVPDVHGIIEDKALRQLQASGLDIGVRSDAHDKLPAGYVIVTDPRAGVSAPRASRVDYVVSLGPRPPGTAAAASTPGTSPSDRPTRPPGSSPSRGPGAAATSGAVVAPTSAGPTTSPLPSSSGRPLGVPTPAPSGPMSPSPSRWAAGTPSPLPTFPESARPALPPWPTLPPIATAAPPSAPAVTSIPGASPSPFPSDELTLVNDFLCITLGDARDQIESAGLLVGATIPDPPPDDSWLVHEQLPKAGEYAPVGSAVNLRLMDPQVPCPEG